MSFLQHAKIRTKIILVLLSVCVVGAAGALLMSYNFKSIDRAYSDLLAKDDVVSLELSRANTRMFAMSYFAYQSLAVDDGPDTIASAKAYDDNKKLLFDGLAKIKSIAPERASDIDGVVGRLNDMAALTDQAVKAAATNNDANAKALLKKADPLIATARTEIRKLLDASVNRVDDKSNALSDNTNNTILYTLSVLGTVFVLALIAALFVVSRGIVGPVEALRARMTSLAAGEAEADVPGRERRDELGQMAAAVAVFRDNA
ncbi:HAMP domain-containing protein, partial [Oryzifoliimicrobium ureilyticus]|uniref:HAMP domain-containing protein n=1 Tax=Oryzifoliimicrobium ureilyticus TaxID=3113724 RepID=UPI0030761633